MSFVFADVRFSPFSVKKESYVLTAVLTEISYYNCIPCYFMLL